MIVAANLSGQPDLLMRRPTVALLHLTTMRDASCDKATAGRRTPKQHLNSCPGLLSSLHMTRLHLFQELVATYRKYGWELRGVLLTPTTQAELSGRESDLAALPVKDSSFDALWFSRPSHQNREAWELRLLAETQYALFESFEPDETEEQRDEMKQEMEARMRDYLSGGTGERGH